MTAEYRIAKRPAGRVLVDYNQNAWGRTLASVYSLRPRPLAAVSTPVTWNEVEAGARIEDFDLDNMPARIAARRRPVGAAARRARPLRPRDPAAPLRRIVPGARGARPRAYWRGSPSPLTAIVGPGGDHLHAVVDAAEVVGDVLVLRRRRGDVLAAAHVAGPIADPEAVDVGAERAAGDGAADRRHRLAGAAADLVAEDPAEDAADDPAGNVQVAALALGCCSVQQRCSGGPTTARTAVIGRRSALVRTLAVFVGRRRQRLRLLVGCVAAALSLTGRTDEIRFSRPMPRSES